MQALICTYVGGHYISPAMLSAKVPLNPILGETVQRVSKDGKTKYLAEQISHHPPITAFDLEGPNYKMTGSFENKAWPTGLNTVKGGRDGAWKFRF